jgi:hypothetical protein
MIKNEHKKMLIAKRFVIILAFNQNLINGFDCINSKSLIFYNYLAIIHRLSAINQENKAF